MSIKRILLTTASVLAVAGAAAVYVVGWGRPPGINWMIERQTAYALIHDPEMLTSVGLLDGTLLDFHSGKLDHATAQEMRDGIDRLRRYAGEIASYHGLTGQEAVSQAVMLEFYNDQLAQTDFPWASYTGGLYPVDQIFSAVVSLPQFMNDAHAVTDRRSAERYISRLHEFRRRFQELGVDALHQASQGVVPPDFIIEKSLDVLEGFIQPVAADNALVTGFKGKLDQTKLSDADKEALVADAVRAVADDVYPAYHDLATLLRSQILPKATHEAGVWRLPDGDRYYQAALRANTTTDLSPDRIHELGLSEVARVTAEMDALLRAQGYTEGSVGERMTRLGREARFRYPDGPEGKKQGLADLQRMVDGVMAKAPQWFNKLPPQKLLVQAVPEYAEATAPGGYYNGPALDGSRPGIFYANLGPAREPTFKMPTLVYHEGVPGHHFQIALAETLTGIPTFRKLFPFNAYAEGWALYAERLAKEMGMYDSDPFGDLGRLSDELFRATRLVVDTGIHAKRWSREQAVDYLVDTVGMTPAGATIEIDRYIIAPGQACGYKVGQLKILELREKARAALGDKFDIRAFHDVVLGSGGLPLTVLQDQVDRWIAAQGVTPAGAAPAAVKS